MARYLVESRQKRLEREAREKREQEEREQRKKQKQVISLRRKYLKEKYGAEPEQAPVERQRTRVDSDKAARQAELIQAHQRSQLDDDDERFYVIEKLIDKRITRGAEEYLVRWQNYPPEDDSWEPRAELERNALDMINAFNNIPQPELNKMKHCICKRAYTPGKGAMIQCSTCETWYHFSCLNLNLYEANCYADYNCNECRSKNPSLKCVIKLGKINKLQGLTRMKVDKNTGVILESPARQK